MKRATGDGGELSEREEGRRRAEGERLESKEGRQERKGGLLPRAPQAVDRTVQ